MIGLRSYKVSLCLAAFMAGSVIPAFADNSLLTTYSFNGPNTIDMETCGSAFTEQGCFGGGSLLRLNGVCSLLAGPPTTQGNVTKQELYLLETGSDAAPVVTLKVYSQTVRAQQIMSGPTPTTKVTTTATLSKSVTITSLKGGTGVTCNMAANGASIFLSTSAKPLAVQVNKANFSVHPIAGGRVHEMLADEEGHVTVIFEGSNPKQYTFGPDGKNISLGGIANPPVILNQMTGVPLN